MESPIQQRFTDATQYETMMGRVFAGYEQLPAIVLSHLQPRLARTARVLDVGCGTGTTLLTFARHEPDWVLVGVDPAAPMLELARARAGEQGVGARVTFVVGTPDELPDEPAFDAATCLLVEHLLPDDGAKLRLLRGIASRLAPGGTLALVSLSGDLHAPEAREGLEAWIRFGALQGLPDAAQATVRRRATAEDSVIDETRLRALLEEAGFTVPRAILRLHLLRGWLVQRG